ncbi:hypothetical protein GC197_17690 [bacterium]|nr:hypothetical protein [bacterium]
MDFEATEPRSPVDWTTPLLKLAIVSIGLGLFAIFRVSIILGLLPYLQLLPGIMLAIFAIGIIQPRRKALICCLIGLAVGLTFTPVFYASPVPRRWYLYLEDFAASRAYDSLPLLVSVVVSIIGALIWIAFFPSPRRENANS